MTTRTLYILRHASAAPPSPGQADYDRALDAPGWEDGKALGRLLAERGIAVGLAVTSGARRTRQTCEALAAGGFAVRTTVDDDLYNGDADAYGTVAKRHGAGDAMIVGHNPMISDFALALVTQPDGSAGLASGLRTCALAIVELDEDPDEASATRCTLKELIEPPFDT